MNDIYSASLLDLLPESLKRDPEVVALAKAVDPEIRAIAEDIKKVEILSRIDELPEPVLDHLLYQFHITFDEGAGLITSVEEKRRFIKSAIQIHRIKGTKRALEMVLEILDIRGVIKEWFEYGGEPYHFRIDILEVTTKGLSNEILGLLDRLIEQYKRKSAWLESIRIYLTNKGKMHLASVLQSGEEITVYPWQQREIETKGYARFGSSAVTVETMTVYPRG